MSQFFRAKVSKRNQHVIDGGYWYENRIKKRNGVLSSMDIMVSREKKNDGNNNVGGNPGDPGGAAPGRRPSRSRSKPRRGPEALVVEILTVEIADYEKN